MNEEYCRSAHCLGMERKVLLNSLSNRKRAEKAFLNLPYTGLHPAPGFAVARADVAARSSAGGCRCTMQMYKKKTHSTESELSSSRLQKYQELRQTSPYKLLVQLRSSRELR